MDTPRPHPVRVAERPRPETAVQFLGQLPTVRSNQALLPVAIALFLVVAGEGSFLRLTARLRGGPSGTG